MWFFTLKEDSTHSILGFWIYLEKNSIVVVQMTDDKIASSGSIPNRVLNVFFLWYADYQKHGSSGEGST